MWWGLGDVVWGCARILFFIDKSRVLFSFWLRFPNIFFSKPPNPAEGHTGVKKKDETHANNKRPISLLSILDRILKKWCIKEWCILSMIRISCFHRSMVLERGFLLNRPLYVSLVQFSLIWINVYLPVEFLLTLRKLSIQLTIKFFQISLIVMVFVE